MKKLFISIIIIEIILLGVFVFTPDTVLANGDSGEVKELFNPMGWININTPGEVVLVGFQGFASIIALIAIAFTVISGFKMAVATNDDAYNSAKQSLTWAVGGFVVAILAFTIIAGSGRLMGFDPSEITLDGTDRIPNPISIDGDDLTEAKSGDFIFVMFYIMRGFLGLLGFATILLIIYHGFRYLTSAGNEEAIEKAKNGLKWALLGLIVALLGYTIITVVRDLLLF